MIAHGKDIKIFTGNSNPELAKEICKELGYSDAEIEKFLADKTIFVDTL